MEKKLKCPYCKSENVTRMDGSKTARRLGGGVMLDIAPEIVHCNACKRDFRAPLFAGDFDEEQLDLQ